MRKDRMKMIEESPNCEKTIRTIDVDGQHLRVAEAKRGSERPLLLFNGIGANVETATNFIRAIDRTHTIIFDIPGIGESPTPLLPYRLSNMARLAARLLDQLGYDKVDVMGASWGGGLAQQFAHDFPDLCGRLILAVTTAGMVMVPGDLTAVLKMLSPARLMDPEYMTRIAPEIYGGLMRNKEKYVQGHIANVRACDSRGYLYQVLSTLGWTSFHWLHRLRLPTLILTGDDDPLVPAINGKIMACRMPNATARTVKGGHMFLITQPQESAAIIENFLREEGEFARTGESCRDRSNSLWNLPCTFLDLVRDFVGLL
jgi:poly(3-hydroxyalkanoate) depolymerase